MSLFENISTILNNLLFKNFGNVRQVHLDTMLILICFQVHPLKATSALQVFIYYGQIFKN